MGVQVDDGFVNATHAPLALLHYLRLEGAVAVPGHLQVERTPLGLDALPRVAVAAVAAVLACYSVWRVAQVVRQLRIEGRLDGALAYGAEQALPVQQGLYVPIEILKRSRAASFALSSVPAWRVLLVVVKTCVKVKLHSFLDTLSCGHGDRHVGQAATVLRSCYVKIGLTFSFFAPYIAAVCARRAKPEAGAPVSITVHPCASAVPAEIALAASVKDCL